MEVYARHVWRSVGMYKLLIVHVQYVMLYDMIVVGVTMSDTTVYVYRCYCDV